MQTTCQLAMAPAKRRGGGNVPGGNQERRFLISVDKNRWTMPGHKRGGWRKQIPMSKFGVRISRDPADETPRTGIWERTTYPGVPRALTTAGHKAWLGREKGGRIWAHLNTNSVTHGCLERTLPGDCRQALGWQKTHNHPTEHQ